MKIVNGTFVDHDPSAILMRMEIELEGTAAAGLDAWHDVRSQARRLPPRELRSVVLTGCGDSYYAALSARALFEQWTGLPTIALPAMEAAAFPPLLLDERALLVVISVSGKVERTIEAAAAHLARGGTAIAVSAYADSDLASACGQVVATGIRGTPGPVPGTANYLGSLLGLCSIAAALGEQRGHTVVSDEKVVQTLGDLQTLVADGAGRADEEARRLTPPFFAIGSGPDLGAAWFGTAKFLEAAATVGVAQDLEEWAHEQFFATGPETSVFVMAGTPAARPRAARAGGSAIKVGARLVTIGPRPLGVQAEVHWPVSVATPELSPLLQWVPLTQTALAYARTAERYPFGIDMRNRMRTVDEDIYLAEPRRA